MRNALLVLLLLCLCYPAFSQEQVKPGRYYFEAQPFTPFYTYDIVTQAKGPVKRNLFSAKFRVANDQPIIINDTAYVIIVFYNFNLKSEKGITYKGGDNDTARIRLTNSSVFINSSDNNMPFLIEASKLTGSSMSKSITAYVRSFSHSDIVYGANLSTPFKFRPKVDGRNYIFSPSVNLGGYVGYRLNLSDQVDDQIFITLPVVSAGFTTIQINEEAQADPDGKDGLAWGFTTSFGTVIQLKDFQLGVLMGWDFVSGEMGSNWRYNEKPWLSFSIGYSFLGGSKGDKNNDEKAKNQAAASLMNIVEKQNAAAAEAASVAHNGLPGQGANTTAGQPGTQPNSSQPGNNTTTQQPTNLSDNPPSQVPVNSENIRENIMVK